MSLGEAGRQAGLLRGRGLLEPQEGGLRDGGGRADGSVVAVGGTLQGGELRRSDMGVALGCGGSRRRGNGGRGFGSDGGGGDGRRLGRGGLLGGLQEALPHGCRGRAADGETRRRRSVMRRRSPAGRGRDRVSGFSGSVLCLRGWTGPKWNRAHLNLNSSAFL